MVEAKGHQLHGDEDGTVAAADDDRVVVGGIDGDVAADTEMIVADAGDIPAAGLVASSSSKSAVVKVHDDDDDDKEHVSAAGDAGGEDEEEPADSPNFHCCLLHDDDEAEHAADTSKWVWRWVAMVKSIPANRHGEDGCDDPFPPDEGSQHPASVKIDCCRCACLLIVAAAALYRVRRLAGPPQWPPFPSCVGDNDVDAAAQRAACGASDRLD